MTRQTFFRRLLTQPAFWFRFADHLDQSCPQGWSKVEHWGTCTSVCITIDGTDSWLQALHATCKQCRMINCWNWYDALAWYNRAAIDQTLVNILSATVFDLRGNRITWQQELKGRTIYNERFWIAFQTIAVIFLIVKFIIAHG